MFIITCTANGKCIIFEISRIKRFYTLQTLLGTQVSAHLSGVASPTDALGKLRQQFAGKVHEVTPSTKVDDLPMSDEGHDMLVVHLPATRQGQVENTLKQSGMLILSSLFMHEILLSNTTP